MPRAEHADGLALWIQEVVALHARARVALRVDVVHDLRVAIRRCRSLAQGLRAIDDDAGAAQWRALSDIGRPLFQGLGDLRDAQVMREHATAILPAEDPASRIVLSSIDARIRQGRTGARTAVEGFDPSTWAAAGAGLPARAQALMHERPLFDHLALRRFFEARALHHQAARSKSSTALHALRIAVKKLRYTVENFLPDAHAKIGKLLKKMQEVLGEVHDFDVLLAFIGSEETRLHSTERGRVCAVVRGARDERVAAYRAMTSEWPRLRAALVSGDGVQLAHLAYIARRAHGRASAVDARRLERAAVTLFRALRRELPGARDTRAAFLLRAACHAALVDGGGKAARRFAERLPEAIGLARKDVVEIGLLARAAIGECPILDEKRMEDLPARERLLIVSLGAVVHLAWALLPAGPFVVKRGKDVVGLHTSQHADITHRRAPLEALLRRPIWISAAQPPAGARPRAPRRAQPAA